jgi:hypothetical protein
MEFMHAFGLVKWITYVAATQDQIYWFMYNSAFPIIFSNGIMEVFRHAH